MLNKILILYILFLNLSLSINAQDNFNKIHPDILNTKWSAKWIFNPDASKEKYDVWNFRKTFELAAKPSTFIIHVSADNRYKLYVNEALVSLGPARNDANNWNFETVDIAPFLNEGENVVAALVWNFGPDAPIAEMNGNPAFILQGNTEKERILDSDTSWKVITNKAYSPIKTDLLTYYVVGPGEKVDFNQYPHGWKKINLNTSGWKSAGQIHPGLPKHYWEPWLQGKSLQPRPIPAMEYKPERIKKLRIAEGVKVPAGFPESQGVSLEIPSQKKVTLILDQTFLTNGYPVLKFSKGKNTIIRIKYAESLYMPDKTKSGAEQSKGNRNDVEGKVFVGAYDEIISDGGENRVFESLWWRTWRYIELSIETKDTPLVINDFYGIYSAYPFDLNAKFNAGDQELDKMLEIGWRTARLCANETYMDCPYYEQLQYVGDTRIQALVAIYNSGDTRLIKNAIQQLRNSIAADGITTSRYPSSDPQYIPPFSLYWIGMVNDYWMYVGDTSFVKSMLPGVRTVLDYFQRWSKEDGTLGKMPHWNFVDWVNNWRGGVPDRDKDGNAAPLDLQLLITYKLAASLEKSIGEECSYVKFNDLARKLENRIVAKYWDKNRGLFADDPAHKTFSQQANTFAVLAGVVAGNEAKSIMEKVLTDTTLIRSSIFFKYYLNQAVVKAGLGDLYLDLLGDWRKQMSYGLTTWSETTEEPRSDCHAWGASPNIELFRTVLGIDTDAPGFSKVKIEPHLGRLKKASGKIPHPNGEIVVKYVIGKNEKLSAEITLPPNTTGSFIWKGKQMDLKEGTQKIDHRLF